MDAEDFACKPGAEVMIRIVFVFHYHDLDDQVSQPVVRVSPGINISMECRVEGSPRPAVRLVTS